MAIGLQEIIPLLPLFQDITDMLSFFEQKAFKILVCTNFFMLSFRRITPKGKKIPMQTKQFSKTMYIIVMSKSSLKPKWTTVISSIEKIPKSPKTFKNCNIGKSWSPSLGDTFEKRSFILTWIVTAIDKAVKIKKSPPNPGATGL